jgi:hypothetical protein
VSLNPLSDHLPKPLSKKNLEGMVATVQATPINELSQELFVFMVVEEMMSLKMYALAECVVSFVGLRSDPVK